MSSSSLSIDNHVADHITDRIRNSLRMFQEQGGGPGNSSTGIGGTAISGGGSRGGSRGADTHALLDDLCYEYSRNIRSYSDNMRTILRLFEQHTTNQTISDADADVDVDAGRSRSRRSRPTHHMNTINIERGGASDERRGASGGSGRGGFSDRAMFRRHANEDTTLYDITISYQSPGHDEEDVDSTLSTTTATTLTLTRDEIESRIRRYVYSPEMEEIVCAITHEVILDGEEVAEIRVCKHKFRPNHLMEWLTRSPFPKCPICRHSI